jgi:hypothetical protein
MTDAVFDQTGIALQAQHRIYIVADKLFDETHRLYNGLPPLSGDEVRRATFGAIAQLTESEKSLRSRLAEIATVMPSLAPNRSALVALRTLAKFATDLRGAVENDPDDPTDGIRDVLCEALRHDHAKAFMEQSSAAQGLPRGAKDAPHPH